MTVIDVDVAGVGGRRHDNEKTAILLDELAALAPAQRRTLATELRTVSETFANVSDGTVASHVLGVLAYLLDPV